MKSFLNLLAVFVVSIITIGCAENKTFKKSDGTEFTSQPYGWMTKEKAIKGVDYELCTDNIVLSVVFCETAIVPVLLTGLELWQPVSYNETNNNKQ